MVGNATAPTVPSVSSVVVTAPAEVGAPRQAGTSAPGPAPGVVSSGAGRVRGMVEMGLWMGIWALTVLGWAWGMMELGVVW